MARVKRRGLDYFPLNTDFIHDRLTRRIMKREGDGALAILLGALSCIYAGEGYYVRTDNLFYEDISSCLYEKNEEDVRRILALAVEYGIFDAALFEKYGILTSAEIQRQYIFSTRRRRSTLIDPLYRLTDEEEDEEPSAGKTEEGTSPSTPESVTQTPKNVTQTPGNVTQTPENVTSGTHSIAQQSIAQQSKAYPPPSAPGTAEGGISEVADSSSAEEEYLKKICEMKPPQDGTPRNLEGLLLSLRQFRIPAAEQYALVLKSNFGAIGHPMWKGFSTLRSDHGKIRQPGRYLLSLCYPKGSS